MKKMIIITLRLLFLSGYALSQSLGSLSGVITDAATKEVLPFVNVVLIQNGKQIIGTIADFDGEYSLDKIPIGNYEVRVSYFGYENEIVPRSIEKNTNSFMKFSLTENILDVEEIDVIVSRTKLISYCCVCYSRCGFGEIHAILPTETIVTDTSKPDGNLNMEDEFILNIDMYPNPTTDVVNISSNSEIGIISLLN